MTLLERLRSLRTDPLIMAWVDDSDVMWLPGYSDGRIIIPFCKMKKESNYFMLEMTGTSVELKASDLKLVKMERDSEVAETEAFSILSCDSMKCREMSLRYFEEMDRYLKDKDDSLLAELKNYSQEIEGLLRRIP